MRRLFPRHGPTSRARGACLVGLATLLLVAPSSELQWFSGLPLNTPSEFLAAMIVAPFLLDRRLRRALARAIGSRRRWAALMIAAAGALVVKGVLLTSAPPPGFLACYRSPLAEPPVGDCERSYDNPFGRFGVTRIDRVLAFERSSWNLSFLNDLRVVDAPGIDPEAVPRTRYPFEARWRAEIGGSEASTVTAYYVGEGTVRIGDPATSIRLPPSYDRVASVSWEMPPARRPFELVYRFDGRSRGARAVATDPQAALRVVEVGDDGRPARLLMASPAPSTWSALAVVADLVTVALLSLLATVAVGIMWPDRWLALVAGAMAYTIAVHPGAVERHYAALVTICGLMVVGLVFPRRRRGLLTFYVVLAVVAARLGVEQASWNVVLYRTFRDDWLNYESLGRTILEQWSLHGGADVFYYQPLARYVTFLTHLTLGDTDVPIALLNQTLVSFGPCYLALAIGPALRSAGSRWLAAGAGVSALLVVNGQRVSNLVAIGASEYPTWIWLPVALALLTRRGARGRALAVGALLGGLSVTARANQAIGVAMLLVTTTHATPWRRRLAAAGIAGLIAMMPVLHNWYYGGVPTFVVGGLRHSLDLAEGDEFRTAVAGDVATTSELWERLLDHARGVAFVGQDLNEWPTFALGVRLVQIVWVSGLVAAVWRLGLGSPVTWLLLVPLGYLLPHLVYQVSVYYPRHIVIGHLAMGCTAMVATTHLDDPPPRGG